MNPTHTSIERLPEGVLRERIAALGVTPTRFEPIIGGYTPAGRYRAWLDDGSTCFAKVAADANTATWLRREREVYAALRGDFMPRVLGFSAGVLPILLLEDLSEAYWPPPWKPGQPEAVKATMEEVARQRPPGLKLARVADEAGLIGGWQTIADDPEPFLALGLVTAAWLARSLEALIGLSTASAIDGEDLLHCDLRSDNLCFVGDRVVLIDWNFVCAGDRRLDIGAWACSLHAEGGPAPEAMLPAGGDIAAVMSGYFGARAGLPVIPTAPRVREVQRFQLTAALPWVQRALGLPPLDGAVACVPGVATQGSSTRPMK